MSNKLWDGLNGRKIPIALIALALGTVSTWAVTNHQVKEHDKILKPMPAQIAVIEEKVVNMEKGFKGFRDGYKQDQHALDGKLERIWQAVK